jgi:hypothetical protein
VPGRLPGGVRNYLIEYLPGTVHKASVGGIQEQCVRAYLGPGMDPAELGGPAAKDFGCADAREGTRPSLRLDGPA